MHRFAVFVGTVAVGCAAVSGCSFSIGGGPPSVSQEDLQKDIADRLAKAGDKPESVTCEAPLVGEVGKSTKCDVVLSKTNSFQPFVTVTKVDGSTVNYEMTPAMSKEQVAEFVESNEDTGADRHVEKVTCDSDLKGEKDAETYCDVETTEYNAVSRRVVVTSVDGLLMNIKVTGLLRKKALQKGMLDLLEQSAGHRPDTAVCEDDLVGEVDYTTECTITDEGEDTVYTVSVTNVDGSNIDFHYQPKE